MEIPEFRRSLAVTLIQYIRGRSDTSYDKHGLQITKASNSGKFENGLDLDPMNSEN